MAIIKSFASFQNLSNFQVFENDELPNSEYFRITELGETLSGGKNGFLIEGSEHLKESTEIKIEILDVEGNPIYFEPGNGTPEYYEGNSKLIAVHVYDDTPIGIGKITILGELKTYLGEGDSIEDVPQEWKGVYNVKWQRTLQVNRNISNETIVRFYRRPDVRIDELVKPIFSKTIPQVTQTGNLIGTPLNPNEGTDLSTWRAGTQYKLTISDDSTWTSSVDENIISIPSINYFPKVREVLSNTEVVVDTPYTSSQNIVSSFPQQAYTTTFNHTEGQTIGESSLTGSFAKISITSLKTFVGDVARVKVYRKSKNGVGGFQFVQESKLESTELLKDITTANDTELSYGRLDVNNLYNYWVTSSSEHITTIDNTILMSSAKVDYNDEVGGVQTLSTRDTFNISKDVEYTLNFKTLLSGSDGTSQSIRAYFSGSNFEQEFLSIDGSKTKSSSKSRNLFERSGNRRRNTLQIYKTRQNVSQNILATDSVSDVHLKFDISGSDWYVSNISLKNAQDTSFSPDEFTLIQDIPRKLASETFDFRFEFYDINNNYIPVDVNATKEFDGGNDFPTSGKLLTFESDRNAFRFVSGSVQSPENQAIQFKIGASNLTGSVLFTSAAFDVDGNYLSPSDYSHYPGLLTSITPAGALVTVNNFTGSRTDGNKHPYVGSIVYTASLEEQEEFETVYRLEDGDNVPQLLVTSNTNQFIYEPTTLSPKPSDQSITIRAKRKNLASYSTPITVNSGSNTPPISGSTDNTNGIDTYTLDSRYFSASFSENNFDSVTYSFTGSDQFGINFSDEITISKVINFDAVSLVLTNESTTFPAKSTGEVTSNFESSKGNVQMFVGGTQIGHDDVGGGRNKNTFDITSIVETNVTAVDTSPTTSEYGISTFPNQHDSGSLLLNIEYLAGDSATSQSFQKVVSYTKSKKAQPSITFSATPQAQTINANSTGGLTGTIQDVTIAGFDGNTTLTYNQGTLSEGQYKITNVTGVTVNDTTPSTSTIDITSFTDDTSTATVSISYIDSEGTAGTSTIKFSLAKSKKGVPNVDVSVNLQSQGINANSVGSGSESPKTIEVNATEGGTDRFTSIGTVVYSGGLSGTVSTNTITFSDTADDMLSDTETITIPVNFTDGEGTSGTKNIVASVSRIREAKPITSIIANPQTQIVSSEYDFLSFSTPSNVSVSVNEGSTDYVYTTGTVTKNKFKITGVTNGTNNNNGTITPNTPTDGTEVAGVITLTLTNSEETTFTNKTINFIVSVASEGSPSKAVYLSISDNSIMYAADGTGPTPSTITLTASTINFRNSYFKFTGGGDLFDDETEFTDGDTSSSKSITFTPPANYITTPLTFRVGVSEALDSTTELESDTESIIFVKPGEDVKPIFYIKPVRGTQIKNAGRNKIIPIYRDDLFEWYSGSFLPPNTLELQVQGIDGTGSFELSGSSQGDAQIYSGSVLLTTSLLGTTDGGNGVTYNPVLDSSAINGQATYTLKSSDGDILDTIALVDVTDGVGGGSFVAAKGKVSRRHPGSGSYAPIYLKANAVFFDTAGSQYTLSTSLTPSFNGLLDEWTIATPGSNQSGTGHIVMTAADGDETNIPFGTAYATKDINVTAVFTDPVTKQTNTINETWYIISDGVDGISAKTVSLASTGQVFIKAKDGTITPSSVTLTATKDNISGSLDFSASNGITLGGTGLTRTITMEEMSGSETSTVVTVSGSEDGLVFQDSISIVRVDTGTDGLTILNTNQAHMFPADATGSILDFSNSGTDLSIYEGATLLEYNPLNPTSPYQGHWKLAASIVSPANKLTIGAITDGGKYAAVADHTAMDIDTDAVNITYGYIGRKLNGELFSGSFQQSITKGRAGRDAIQLTNSNSSHTFPALADGSVSDFTGGGTTIEVYEGAEILTFTTDTVTNGEFSISVEDVGGLTEGTITAASNGTTAANIIPPSAMSVDSVVLTYTISGKRLGGEEFTRTTTQSFSKAKEGVVGTNAKTVALSSVSPIFRKNRAGELSPTSIVITANGQNLTQAGAFSTSAGTLTSKTENSSGGVATVTSANFVDGMVVTYTAHSDDDSIADTVTLAQLDEGSGNVTALLSNEAHIVPANNNGSVDSTSYAGSGTTISVFEGATALDYNGSSTLTAGHWTVAATQSPANKITIGTISDSTNFAVVPDFESMDSNTDSVTISYAISGKTANGTEFTPFTKTQTITKSIAGAVGEGGPSGSQGPTGNEGDGVQFAYYLNNTTAPSTPTAVGVGGWTVGPSLVTISNRYSWVSQRVSSNGTYGNFSAPKMFANFSTNGLSVTGANGLRTVTGRVNTTSALATAPTTVAATKIIFPNTFQGLTSGWSTATPTYEAGTSNTYYFAEYVATEDASRPGWSTSVSFGAITPAIGFSGLVTFQGTTLNASGSFDFTSIDGANIKTGVIRSETLTTSAGSEISLTDGTIKFGGTLAANQKFSVTAAGVVTAKSGTIGGWNLSSDAISVGTATGDDVFMATDGLTLGSGGFISAKEFKISSAGIATFTNNSKVKIGTRIKPWSYILDADDDGLKFKTSTKFGSTSFSTVRTATNGLLEDAGVSGCVLPGTKIISKRGEINIEDTKEDDIIKVFNFETKEFGWSSIDEIFVKKVKGWRIIKTKSGKQLKCSNSHVLYHPDFKQNQALPIRWLLEGDELYILNDNNEIVLDIITSIEIFDEEVEVWNYHLDKVHNYISNGFLSHNAISNNIAKLLTTLSHSYVKRKNVTIGVGDLVKLDSNNELIKVTSAKDTSVTGILWREVSELVIPEYHQTLLNETSSSLDNSFYSASYVDSFGEEIPENQRDSKSIWKVASMGDSVDYAISGSLYTLPGFKVCNQGGDVSRGDLLCSSDTAGYLMKQPTEWVVTSFDGDNIPQYEERQSQCSYTVAKAMKDVVFDSNGLAEGIYGYLYCG